MLGQFRRFRFSAQKPAGGYDDRMMTARGGGAGMAEKGTTQRMVDLIRDQVAQAIAGRVASGKLVGHVLRKMARRYGVPIPDGAKLARRR